jgi:hypothetical protein
MLRRTDMRENSRKHGRDTFQEFDVQKQQWIRPAQAAAMIFLGMCGGCHQKSAPVTTPADIAAAEQEAQHEIAQAQLEAKKDVKSIVKIMGKDSKEVARAKATGAFDIAMAHADGDRKVAVEKCMVLEPSTQPSCKDRAERDYQSTVSKAKAIRDSHLR